MQLRSSRILWLYALHVNFLSGPSIDIIFVSVDIHRCETKIDCVRISQCYYRWINIELRIVSSSWDRQQIMIHNHSLRQQFFAKVALTKVRSTKNRHQSHPKRTQKWKYISSKPIGFQRHIWYLITNNLPTTFDLVFVFQRNRLCLLPWLINNGFSILFSFVVSISVLGILSSNSDNVGTVVLVFIILFVTLSKLTICFIFLRSGSRDVNSETKNEKISYSINIRVRSLKNSFRFLHIHVDRNLLVV